jgi:hypothetical protein
MLHIFIGYDAREDMAYEVAAHSAKRHCSVPCVITPLNLAYLTPGKYWRKHRLEGNQMIDEIDGKPFSTQFSFSRFLVPHIAAANNITDLVVFVDCDFLFLHDIQKMIEFVDPDVAVSVVKHKYHPQNAIKMDGVAQTQYHRKLWSSLMVFNPSHEDCRKLTPELVNSAKGSYLHGFDWTESIGEIDETWNWLPYHSPTTRYSYEEPKAIHFTEGGPWFPNHQNVPYAEKWKDEARLVKHASFNWNHIVDFSK